MNTIAEKLWQCTEELCAYFETHPVHKQGVRVLYPSRYCRRQFQAFYDLAGVGGLLIVGMNPGPNGMGQTGCAFTDQPNVRDLIGADVLRWHDGDLSPDPVGRWRFDNGESNREEDSASRLWPLLVELVSERGGLTIASKAGGRRNVARNVVMINACPLLWLNERGANVSANDSQKRVVMTPEHFAEIHKYLRRIADDILAPAAIVAAGDWAAQRCRMAFGPGKLSKMTHPSPIAGNEETWRGKASPVLRAALDKVFA